MRTLDIVPHCKSSPEKRSGMARVLKGFHSFTCTSTRSSAIGMSQEGNSLTDVVDSHGAVNKL